MLDYREIPVLIFDKGVEIDGVRPPSTHRGSEFSSEHGTLKLDITRRGNEVASLRIKIALAIAYMPVEVESSALTASVMPQAFGNKQLTSFYSDMVRACRERHCG